MIRRIIASLALVFMLQAPVLAQESPVSVSLQSSTLSQDVVEVDVYISVPTGNKVSAATAQIQYPQAVVQFMNADKPSSACTATHKLDQVIALKDTKKGAISLSKVKIGTDDQLASGTFCFATLTFKKKKSFWTFLPWVQKKGSVELTDFNKWEVVGPGATYNPSQISQSDKTKLTVSR